MSTDKSQISNLKSKLATIKLPISKSIANRLLLLQAIHGDSLLPVSSSMPDDVIVLHDALEKIRELFGTPEEYASSPSPCVGEELCSIGRPVVVRRTKRGGVITAWLPCQACSSE